MTRALLNVGCCLTVIAVSSLTQVDGAVGAGPAAAIDLRYADAGADGIVLLNEVCAAPSHRVLRFDEDGHPRLGMGLPWIDPAFDDEAWASGFLPAGYGLSGLSTDLGLAMAGTTPSLYLRKVFTVSTAQAGSSGPLTLEVEFNDGFIAFLNGVEVARANMGPPQHFVYAAQPAYNARPSGSVVSFELGEASEFLVSGENVLAIQAHNAVVDPAGNRFDLTSSFKIDVGLRLQSPSAQLVTRGSGGGPWAYFVGLVEPSGGLVDPALLTGAFSVPPGSEADFEDPEDFSDWVELRNMGADPVEIGGWAFSDSLSNPGKWRFPAGTTIPGSGYLLVLCDRREEMNGVVPTRARTLVQAGETWHYYDQDAAPPGEWKAAAFDHSSWASGPAPLGYSPGNQDGAATLIAGGVNTHYTNYFRRRFTVEDPTAFVGELTIRYQRDDGLVIWLNGTELARDNMSPGIPGHTTPAAAVATGEDGWYTATVPATALVAGENVLAVEVHQISLTSSDVRFDLELTAWESGPGRLHASFSLDEDGEPLTLYTETGSLVDALPGWPKQDSFLSWGRSTTHPEQLGFQEATPGTANQDGVLSAKVAEPKFLMPDGVTVLPSGFYDTAQTLVLQCATPGATIRYTTDGSEPLETGNGQTYSSPIPITRLNDQTAVVIRARAFVDGFRPSKDLTTTYLISQNAAIQSLPVLSLVADAGRTFYLPQGIFSITGGSFDFEGIWRPGEIDSYNVPQHRGPTTERTTSVELIYPDGRKGFRDKVAVRIAGSAYNRPRYHFQHTGESPWKVWDPMEKGSMNLIWRGDIGAPELEFELMPDWPTTHFRQLRLRAGHNDMINPFICDEYIRRLFGELGHDSLRGMFAMLYVNGKFKGIYNVCERLRTETFQEHFDTENDWDIKYAEDFVEGDAVEHSRFRALYDRDMSVPENYEAVQEAADLVNFADYYLLNIYANMWDWATWGVVGNNYILYRERAPDGVWRFTVWDAEASFFHQGYFNPVSYDLIAQDLNGRDNTHELAILWKRLVGVPPYTGFKEKGNPDFRALVADRIHKHFFNGGILDDRHSANRVHTLKNELRDTVSPAIQFLQNSWREDWFNAWVAPTYGRRAYLFGPRDTQFRDAGVWPETAPPVFHQHGGALPADGSAIFRDIPAGSVLYYTTNGVDPRLSEDSVAPAALVYAGAIPIESRVTIKARIRSAAGEWSPLTEATFSVPMAAPSSDTLVVSEIMFNPPPLSAAEGLAGFTDSEDFEFIRLTNVGNVPLDLLDLRLTEGVIFDFSSAGVTVLDPDRSVLLVGDRRAFAQRYGAGPEPSIAGAFDGNLKNGGETLQLELAAPPGTVLHRFAYEDGNAWPLAADGYGASLVLIDPYSTPDPADPRSWTASAHSGGLPDGSPRPLTYEAWKVLSFTADQAAEPAVSGPLADPDLDGLINFAEYALGGSALLLDAASLQPRPFLFPFDGKFYLGLDYQIVPTAIDATVVPEAANDLRHWFSEQTEELRAPHSLTSGQESHRIRLLEPIGSPDHEESFFRLRATEAP